MIQDGTPLSNTTLPHLIYRGTPPLLMYLLLQVTKAENKLNRAKINFFRNFGIEQKPTKCFTLDHHPQYPVLHLPILFKRDLLSADLQNEIRTLLYSHGKTVIPGFQ
uniref:Uncharacterized protein n=1 Tax=Cacopsylla melanoneura TaxID=428564 RepID=A0A8D9ATM3_9HEMI